MGGNIVGIEMPGFRNKDLREFFEYLALVIAFVTRDQCLKSPFWKVLDQLREYASASIHADSFANKQKLGLSTKLEIDTDYFFMQLAIKL